MSTNGMPQDLREAFKARARFLYEHGYSIDNPDEIADRMMATIDAVADGEDISTAIATHYYGDDE